MSPHSVMREETSAENRPARASAATTTKAPSNAAQRTSTAESCADAPATTSDATTATVPGTRP